MARHRSSAAVLAWAWAALVAYASLFPFEGWHWPAGMPAWQLLWLPWPRYFIPFDIVSNLLGYAPLGLLVALAGLRHGASPRRAFVLAVLAGALLSGVMESVQHLLPQRVSSALDWMLNTLGAALGAAAAVAFRRFGALGWWDAARGRWLERGNGGALALLMLWPAALLFPTPVLLGVGQIGPELRQRAVALLADVPWAQPVADWLAAVPVPDQPLAPLTNGLAVVLGLLAPCLLAFAASPRGLRRTGLAAMALMFGLAATTLSSALSFGPEHALAWRTPAQGAALLLALVLALALQWTGPRVAAGLALVALTGLVALVHQAPTDPYLAQNLQAWEQGRFIRFHGLAQWLGWLWPFAAMVWLLGSLGRR